MHRRTEPMRPWRERRPCTAEADASRRPLASHQSLGRTIVLDVLAPLFRSPRRRREDAAVGQEPPRAWPAVLAADMALFATLAADEQERLLVLMQQLAANVDVEAARGFEPDERVAPLVLGHAALLVLGLEPRHLDDLRAVVVHPTTVTLPGTYATAVRGVVRDRSGPLHGQAQLNGPVVVSWRAALRGSRAPWTGRNVLLHELAHKLDMRDGSADGTPSVGPRDQQERFAAVAQDHFDRLRSGRRDPLLRSYAAVNPAEFFAVATEVFFGRPHELATVHPDLHAVLVQAYGQDPASRRPPPGAPPVLDDVDA